VFGGEGFFFFLVWFCWWFFFFLGEVVGFGFVFCFFFFFFLLRWLLVFLGFGFFGGRMSSASLLEGARPSPFFRSTGATVPYSYPSDLVTLSFSCAFSAAFPPLLRELR